MDYKKLLAQPELKSYLMKARLGVEKESQRIDLQGNLATTNHPNNLGNRSYHPYIQTDFSETQTEIITPVTESSSELMRWLAAIHDVTYRSMSPEETLWPLSMPPILPIREEEIILARLDAFEDVLYRRYLAKEYGRRKQMVSGIHYNFEFDDCLMAKLFEQQTIMKEYEAFKTEVYLKVTRNYLRYRWVITYLYGASPISCANYFVDETGPNEPVRSIRSSKFGYTNHDDVHVSYQSLSQYLQDINQMVEEGKLSEEKEFYAPVRLRGGKKVSDLAQTGIRYIELRNVDLNPFARYGIAQEQLDFLHLFMILMLWLEESSADEWVSQGEVINNMVALEHPLAKTQLLAEGQMLVTKLREMMTSLELNHLEAHVLAFEKALQEPTETLAGKLYQAIQAEGQESVALQLAKANYAHGWEKPYQLAGFREMELSTQLLMFNAIQKGVQVELLDEHDQFLKLQFLDHVEYVKNANMTGKDSYVVPLMMENKTVTKKVLAKAGFSVPKGYEYATHQAAMAAYPEFAQKGFVIKPKSTNYGLGISIFKDGADLNDFQEAVTIAFKEDREILIEEFLPGTEYRFFVLDGKVEAIMLRVPANVVGDARHSIRELVALKNQDPLRGTHHRAPLELINLGEIETLMLKEQGLTADDCPPKGQIVYLRENSNVSTGGDSLDVTDEFTSDYKQIAVAAVEALGAKISGIDLIIPDKHVSATKKGAYGIIEANFNPAMHMHTYPYQGQGQNLPLAVLRFLFPEITAD
ncbi:MAG: bifunctional glutamate--cysteine ligase GshA/glutathione synthetase GshB [Enterococcus sp.]